MVDTQILPAAYRYHGELAGAAASAKASGVSSPQNEMLTRLGGTIDQAHTKRTNLENLVTRLESIEEPKHASFWANEISVGMRELREICDKLELQVADEYWPLPKYREMLFLA